MSNVKHYSWSALNRLGIQALSFIGNILIAKQLSPDDYGLIAMLSIIIGISWNFTESGLTEYLIQKKNVDELDYSTIFAYCIFISIIFSIILFFTSTYIASFYKRNELINITKFISISLLFKAITVTEFTRMRKHLEFKKLALIQLLSTCLSIITAYVFALYSFGYWSIVIQIISLSFYNLLFILILNKWKPRFKFDFKRYSLMRKFSNNMLISFLTNQISQNIHSVFIGKTQSSLSLGFYNQATKMNDLSFQSINSIIVTTSYPILVKTKDNIERLELYKKLLNHFLFIQLILCFFLIGISEEIISIILGPKWLITGQYLKTLTLSSMFLPLMTLNANILKIENKTKLYRNLNFLRNGLILLFLILTFKYGTYAIIIGYVIAVNISILFYVQYSGKLINLHTKEQFIIVIKQIISPFISLLISLSFLHFLKFKNELIIFTVFSTLFFLFVLIINKLLKNETQSYYLHKIKKIIK